MPLPQGMRNSWAFYLSKRLQTRTRRTGRPPAKVWRPFSCRASVARMPPDYADFPTVAEHARENRPKVAAKDLRDLASWLLAEGHDDLAAQADDLAAGIAETYHVDEDAP